jgi:hypothetical protein
VAEPEISLVFLCAFFYPAACLIDVDGTAIVRDIEEAVSTQKKGRL